MFLGEDSNVLRRRLQCSLKNPPRFSGEDSKVLQRSMHCSREKRGLLLKHVCKGIFITMEDIVLGYGIF
jgi:hypothetical protein